MTVVFNKNCILHTESDKQTLRREYGLLPPFAPSSLLHIQTFIYSSSGEESVDK